LSKRSLLVLGAAMGILAWAGAVQAVVYDDGVVPQPFPLPGVLIVKYHMPMDVRGASAAATTPDGHIGVESIDRIHDAHGVHSVTRMFPRAANPRYALRRLRDFDRFARIKFPGDADVKSLRIELQADPLVEWVDQEWIFPVDAVPNDPSFGSQWTYSDASDNDIDGVEAWDIETGDTLIILGATDTGVNYEHPDLAGPSPYTSGNIYINWTEYHGTPNVDDDGNGFVDDIHGWDFVDVGSVWAGEDGSLPDNDPMDFNGHGTHISGIMAAMTNNNMGVAGTAGGWYGAQQGCKILPLRMGYSADLNGVERGFVSMAAAAQCFDYGVMMGVHVFNCSWGNSGSSGFGAAVSNALTNGVSIVTSAGNSNANSSGYLENTFGVINVASTRSNGRKSGFSSYGPAVEISAPGSSILSTYSPHTIWTYATLSGTSMASPTVAGAIGLVRSYNPELEKERVDSIIIATADDIDALNPNYIGLLGSGRLNAQKALEATPFAFFAADVVFGQAPLAVQFADHSYMNPTSWSWDLGNGETPTDPNPATVYTAADTYTVSLTTQSDVGTKTTTMVGLVVALADTVGGQATEAIVNHSGTVDFVVVLTVPVDSLFIPFEASGTQDIALDTVTLDGLGAGAFTQVELENFLAGTGKGVMRFRSDTGAVTLGSLPLATFGYSVGQGSPGDSIGIGISTTFPTDSFIVFSPYGSYQPLVLPTVARVAAYPRGDVDLSGFLTSTDVIQMVGFVFRSETLPEPDLANVDGDSDSDTADIIYMVNHLFKGGPPPIG